jgi:hypothetical protein
MFAKTTDVGFAQRVVATLVASAVVLASYGVYTTAQAANLVEVSNTLSTSAPGVNSAHTIDFEIPTGSDLLVTDTVSIIVPAGFVIDAGIAAGDLTVTEDAEGTPNVVVPTGVTLTGQTISFEGVVGAAGETVRVVIADTEITSPTPVTNSESYEFTITTDASGTAKDSGKTRVVIINTVLVTAIVETVFDFTITGLATSTAVNGTSTTGSTSPTSIPFGVLTAGEVKTLAQQLNVQTNAKNGFVVTVESDGDLESSTGAIIDSFTDGTDISVAGTSWASPSNDVNDELTWGHWGMTYEDDATVDLAANEFIAVATTPREVFSHDGPSDNTTTNIGQSLVGYQIEISPLQEAGDDYNTTLTYIATPTF